MTIEERARQTLDHMVRIGACQRGEDPTPLELAIRAAVEEEREACALAAEQHVADLERLSDDAASEGSYDLSAHLDGVREYLATAAATIRARGR